MKKRFLSLALGGLALLLAACGAAKEPGFTPEPEPTPPEYEMTPSFFLYLVPDENYVIPEGVVSLQPIHYDGQWLELTLRNRSSESFSYDESYSLQLEQDGEYTELTPLEDQSWKSTAYELAPGEEVQLFCPLNGVYELEIGSYRLYKTPELYADFSMDGGWTE